MPWTHISTHATGYLYTATDLNNAWNNLTFLEEVAYVEFTSDVSVTATTAGTANQIVSAGAITYENVKHKIEFWCARYSAPAQQTWFLLRDGTTILGTLGNVQASDAEPGVTLERYITPTAASHTYNIASYLGGAGTGTFKAGTGGSAGDGTTYLPGFIRVTRIPT